MEKFSLFIYSILLIMISSSSCKNEIIRLYASKDTEAGEKGFYLFDLNPKAGKFNLISSCEAGPNPSYFCVSKKNGLIYAANEVSNFKGSRGGGVTTLKYFDKTHGIEKINELNVPNGAPCYISLSPNDDFLFMANYDGGSIAVVKLDDRGIPGRVSDTILYQGEEGKVSHAHMISFNPAGKRVYVTDLGLDRIVIYNFDAVSGRLQQIPNGIVKLPKGAGPRHFTFSSDGTKMYVINELNSTISVFNVNTNGDLKSIQTITTLREWYKGESFCAEVHIGKSGKYLYGSNRGENSIVTFMIGTDGLLSLAGHTSCGGDWPRNFVIDPSGKYILVGNQKSGNISLFGIDEKTGIPVEPPGDYKLTSPACLKFPD
jgi:6-phosphogluconolactonase